MTAHMLEGSPEFLKSCGTEAWEDLIRYLLGRVTDCFGCQITTEPLENACAGEGFCVDILYAAPSPDAPIHWKGILGASIVDDRLRISLLVFPYGGSERLATKSGGEFAEYVYVTVKANDGRWELLGWFKDEFGEFNHRFSADETQ